ncbi:MAG: ribosome biogenesis GTPase YlqF [Bacilli bacterium]|nr:ribosome biogenesis GTPase YlqF [Bacilli bacterium]
MQNVQWFPGHMAKAIREIEEKIKLVDIILELIDARIPLSSFNPVIKDKLKNKPRLVIMNKSDMSDEAINIEWKNYFANNNIPCIFVNSKSGENIKKISVMCKDILKEKLDKEKAKGLKPRSIRTMVLGIPNVGKSTLINKLAGKSVANTGNTPGVTKAQQWIRINKDLDLLDTPGVLWPKFEDLKVGYNLALTGAIKDNVIRRDDMILYFLDFLRNSSYSSFFEERYEVSLTDDNLTVLENIAKNKVFYKGEFVDYERIYDLILNDFRNLKLGHITLERPSGEI